MKAFYEGSDYLGWALHIAGGWLRSNVRIDFLVCSPAISRIFLIKLHILAVGFHPSGDVKRLLQLVVGLAHFNFAIQCFEFLTFHRESNLHRIR